MKRELSKDEKIQLGAKIFCGVLCVSLVSGTIAYYKAEEMKAKKQVAYEIENGLNGYEPIEETKNEVLESLMAKPLSDNQLVQIDKNTNTYNTGFDKNGNPYLKKGASYTFKADGTPVEAPPNAEYTELKNQNNGVSYMYSPARQEWANLDEINKEIEFDERVSRGEINSKGTTGRALTQEEMDSVTWSVNVGSMGYK